MPLDIWIALGIGFFAIGICYAIVSAASEREEALRSHLWGMLDAYWGKGDGYPAPKFIQDAIQLVDYKPKD